MYFIKGIIIICRIVNYTRFHQLLFAIIPHFIFGVEIQRAYRRINKEYIQTI